MSWGYVLLGFTLLCGAAVTTYLLVHSSTYLRQSLGTLTPAKRRQLVWTLLGGWGSMLVAAALITAAYQWGAATWSASTGAAIAVVAFVLILSVVFVGLGLQLRREARQDRERRPSAQQQ